MESRTPRLKYNQAKMGLWSWLRCATSLKHLTLIQSILRGSNEDDLKSIDFFQIICLNELCVGETKFPALESLHLKHLTTRGDALCSFLRDHRKTLTSLTIEQPQMRAQDWRSLRSKILKGDCDGMVVRPGVKAMLSETIYGPSAQWEAKYYMLKLFPP